MAALVLFLSAAAAQGQQFGFVVNPGNQNVTLDSYAGPAKVTIPATGAVFVGGKVTNLPVTIISGEAFDLNSTITSVSMPNTITNLAARCFDNCTKLRYVNLPQGLLSIGDTAFEQTALTNVTIPGTVTNMGQNVFFSCLDLTNVTIASGATMIGDYAFASCQALTNIEIPSSVERIGLSPFYNCRDLIAITVDPASTNYTSVDGVLFDAVLDTLINYPEAAPSASYTIPDGVENIAHLAFWSSLFLKNLTISATVTNIGNANGGLDDYGAETNFDADPGNPVFSSINGVLFNKSGTTLMAYPCGLRTSYIIPTGVTNIATYAFTTAIVPNITIPSSMLSFSNGAFAEASVISMFFEGAPPTSQPTTFGYQPTVYYLPGQPGWSPTFAGLTTKLWNPVIQNGGADFGVQNNLFGFDIAGTAGIPVQVQSAENLSDPGSWSAITNITLTNGLFHFIDPNPLSATGRFYRIGAP